MNPTLTDAEVDQICDGLTQNAAKVRFLRGLGLQVERKPNGRPLVRRADWDRNRQAQNAVKATSGPRWSVHA